MPAWLDRVSGWLPNQPFAGWGGWDLAESLTADQLTQAFTVYPSMSGSIA